MPRPLFLNLFLFFILHWTEPVLSQNSDNSSVARSFYITANTGKELEDQTILRAIAEASKEEDSTALLVLGNVTSPLGYPVDSLKRIESQQRLREDLIRPIKDFEGKVIILPGRNEWNDTAPESVEDLESFLQDNGPVEFWPDDGCPIESEALGEDIVIVAVDSQWYLENWDRHPEMNASCDYKTVEEFFMEFKDDLKDSQGKTVIVAIHHPVLSNTQYGWFREITGAGRQNFYHHKQKELRKRLETIASLYDDVIFVSGAHRNLQYIHNDRNPQINVGGLASGEQASAKGEGDFASQKPGYAKLTVFKNGSSMVEFFEIRAGRSELLFSAKIPEERPDIEEVTLPNLPRQDSVAKASIYTKEETSKSAFYRWLWGERYRKIYSKEISAPVLYLDSLPMNVRPIAEGGGQQSRSLRLINDHKNEFTLRAMRKDPLQYIQADLVKENVIGDFLENTLAERFISDYFTTAHPYAPFAVNELSEAAGILHANPELYYVPRQASLDIYNLEHGDALYMLEEHVGEENKEFETFGRADNILSTADLLLELRKSKDAYVDQAAYIRARLFDMLLGDWDRHQDQWRWAEYSEGTRRRFEPIPRDRDHAFSTYDGVMMPILKAAIPLLRKMQPYDEKVDNTKWFNWSGYPLDQRFLTTADWSVWKEQAEFLQQHLTDQVIDSAFATLPKEIQGSGISELKRYLRDRRKNLPTIAKDYYDYLLKFQTLTGTEEEDHFMISRKADGRTEIGMTSKGKSVFYHMYHSDTTEEIWIYGLHGEDRFTVEGDGEDLIELKIIGGDEKDTYDFSNTEDVKLYDHKSTPSEIINPHSRKRLLDSYDVNTYHYTKRKYSENRILPKIDFEPDAGFTLGLKNQFTQYGLVRNPFTSQYTLEAQYYFASNGYKIGAETEFAHLFYNSNLHISGYYSSPNYTLNYFGYGNESKYDPNQVDRRFNRIKMEEWKISPGLVWRKNESSLKIAPFLESYRVVEDPQGFLSTEFSSFHPVFSQQLYTGGEVNYHYINKDNPSFPRLGSEFALQMGYRKNINDFDNEFGFVSPSFSFDYPLVPSGFAVFASKIGGKTIVGENFEFYHAATLGGNNSLRGYRNHRFSGKTSFYHSSDLRSALGLIKTGVVPLVYGISAGFDYGRVWTAEGNSERWHSNYGGSLWINGFYALTANVGLYHGEDGNRLSITLNFKY